jgi:hypothetical protein
MSSPRERVTEHSPYYRWGQIQTADLSAVNNLVRESNISPLATSADVKERGRRKTKFTTEQTSSVVRRTPDFGGQVARHTKEIVNKAGATSA